MTTINLTIRFFILPCTFLLLAAAIFISCQSKTGTEVTVVPEEILPDNTKEQDSIESVEIVPEEIEPNDSTTSEDEYTEQFEEYADFDALQDITGRWVQLSEINGKNVIIEPCDVQNPTITIDFFPEGGGTPVIYLGFGQDTKIFEVISASWNKKKQLIVECVDEYKLTFTWKEKAKGLCLWHITDSLDNSDYVNNALFSDDEFVGNYEVIREECDEEF